MPLQVSGPSLEMGGHTIGERIHDDLAKIESVSGHETLRCYVTDGDADKLVEAMTTPF